MSTNYEDELYSQLHWTQVGGEWHREYRFHPTRKWRFDLAQIELGLAVEIEGAIFGKPGRHQRIDGMNADCEKYAEAMVMGWQVLRVTTRQVRSGQALDWIEKIVKRIRYWGRYNYSES